MNKKLITILGITLSLAGFSGAVNAEDGEKLNSPLEMVCDENFENYYDGYVPKDFIGESGSSDVKIIDENGNKFVRMRNRVERESRVVYTLEQTVNGRFVIEYDSRAAFVSICDMPSVLGKNEEGITGQEIVRVRITDSGKMQFNQTQSNVIESSKTVSQWKHNKIIVDTETGNCIFIYGDEEIGTYPLNIKGGEISKLRFASRNTNQNIDIDNIKVYYDNEDTVTSEDANDNSSDGIPMPVRNYRNPAQAYKARETINVDGDLSETDWGYCKKYSLCNIGQGTPSADAAFSVLRDDGGVYVGVTVYDKTLNDVAPENEGWLRDQIEIYIDGMNNHSNIYDDDDRQYSYGLNCNAPDNHNGERKRFGENMKYAQKITDYGWTAELYIPFKDLCDKQYEVGDSIGFDVAYNDSNTENVRAGQLFWRGSSQNSSITNAFGDLLLADGNAGDALTEADKAVSGTLFFEVWNRYALENGIRRKIDANHSSVTPRNIDGVIYLPFRFAAEESGYKISYDGEKNAIKAEASDNIINIGLNNTEIIKNESVFQLKNELNIIDDFLYISAEDFAQLTNKKTTVKQDCVVIGSDNVSDEVAEQIKIMKNTK